jgi:hypothetical protein
MCWTYNGYDGEIEWVNTMHFCTEPKYNAPTGIRYSFREGLIWVGNLQPSPLPLIPDFIVNGIATNLLSGKNMPPIFPG